MIKQNLNKILDDLLNKSKNVRNEQIASSELVKPSINVSYCDTFIVIFTVLYSNFSKMIFFSHNLSNAEL